MAFVRLRQLVRASGEFHELAQHRVASRAAASAVQGAHGERTRSETASRLAAAAGVATAALAIAGLVAADYPRVECFPDQRGRYMLYKELGRGGFSIVRLAVDTKTNEFVAAKIFDPKFCSADAIRAEIDMLKYLGHHRHIVSLHDVLYLKDETIMFTDLVQGGELFDYIVDMGSISECDASRLLYEVCLGLEYVHARGVCHRDLKPENVLLTDQSSEADLKIADFGLSRRQRKGEKVVESHPSGTIAYWAPEIIKHEPQDFGVDMWAFGVLAYITLTGVHPFDPRGDRSDAEIITQIGKGVYDVENQWFRELSPGAKGFLANLLNPDPAKRLTAKQALQHPWLRGQTPATTPLPDGHTQRLLSYQRLQKLRANILTVIMGVQHVKFEEKDAGPTAKPQPGKPLTAEQQRTTTVNMDMFKEAFALFDKDDSGDIDKNELANVLISLGQHLNKSDIDAIMREADTDGDGKISFMEFVTMMNERLFKRGELTEADLKAAFNLFDSNHDGFINGSELEHVMHVLGNKTITSAEVKAIIEAVDVNGDGKIDFDEFCVLMRAGLDKKAALHAQDEREQA